MHGEAEKKFVARLGIGVGAAWEINFAHGPQRSWRPGSIE